ncbi:chaoptin, partial [Caerostris extrusa]
NLAFLDLAGNFLKDLPVHLWKKINKLHELDVSNNPIPGLRVNSFAGLERLQKSGHQETFAKIPTQLVRSFRLQDLLSNALALRSVTINIEESSLSHQVQSAFGTKLRELIISGSNLRRIFPGRFLWVVHLRTDHTNQRHLGNRIPYWTAEVLKGCFTGRQSLICSCELVWMGKWLRRWLRETFHVHMLSIEAMLYVNSVARKTRCSVPNTNITFAVIDLRPSDIHCQKSVGNAFCASCSVTVIYGRSVLLCIVFISYVCYDTS